MIFGETSQLKAIVADNYNMAGPGDIRRTSDAAAGSALAAEGPATPGADDAAPDTRAMSDPGDRYEGASPGDAVASPPLRFQAPGVLVSTTGDALDAAPAQGSRENPIPIVRADGAAWEIPVGLHDITEELIDEIVRAIVGQDREFYDGDASRISKGDDCFRNRRYRIGNRVVSLQTLAGWVRKARGYKVNERGELSDGLIVAGWKQLFGIKGREGAIPITISFDLSRHTTLGQIDAIVQAIVAQDHKLYPKGNATSMSTSPRYLGNRWYRIGSRDVTLATLAGWVRVAQGMGVSNTRALPDSAIVADWRERLFGIERVAIERHAIQIEVDIKPSRHLTLEQIDAIIRAIVAQDHERYSGKIATPMSAGNRYFRRWYRIGGRELTLQTLARWVRIKKGHRAHDIKNLPNSVIVNDWKRRLFGIDTTPMAAEEFQEWVDEHGLADVVAVLEDAPDALDDFVRALALDLSDYQVVRLMRAFAEVRLGLGWSPTAVNREAPPYLHDPLIRALLARRDLLERMDAERIERLARALARHWQRPFNRDPHGTVAVLGRLIAETTDPRIQALLTTVRDRFQATLGFDPENVRTRLHPFQREGAMFLASRPAAILADEPGLGKTLQAIAAVEHLRAGNSGRLKALVIAPASVKRAWADQLSTDSTRGHLSSVRG